MMKKNGLILSAALALGCAAAGAMAAPLTPRQALQSLRNSAAHSRVYKKTAAMELSHTMRSGGAATLYVFAPPGPAATGFVIVSADDAATPLLGYSETSAFDPSCIPPQLQWWLDCCSAGVARLAENPGQASDLSNGRARRADRAPIAPLCSTRWDQTSPYNDLCPLLGGERAVAGCVATAMAQVMKRHEWPERGAGTHTYTYTYGDDEYTDTFDFGAATFDWTRMLDEYLEGQYTEAQGAAVATLMHACGNASRMDYSPQGSSTYLMTGAIGLIDRLNYDRGIECLFRDWFLAQEWDDMIYGELAEGRPLVYDGSNQEMGHAFVCDGYDAGFYHINWGWGGLADGYFLLSELTPCIQGVGGNSEGAGYNLQQGAVFGIQKPVEGSERPLNFGYLDISLDGETFSRAKGDTIWFNSDRSFMNYSTYTLPTLYFGLILESEAETRYVTAEGPYEFQVMQGFKKFNVTADMLPTGTWKAYPAVSLDNETWTKMRHNPVQSGGYINLDVTDRTVTATLSAGVEDPGLDADFDPIATEVTFTRQDGPEECTIGETYSYTYEIAANGRWNQYLLLLLVNYETMAIYAFGTDETLNLIQAGSVTTTFSITIPEWVGPGSHYFMALCSYDDENIYKAKDCFDVTLVSGASGIESPAAVAPAEYFDLSGRRIAAPAPRGISIERRGGATRKRIGR